MGTTKKKAPTHIGDLRPDQSNRRAHTPRNIGMIVDSLQHVGAGRSIVIDETGEVLAGNGVLEAASEAGITRVKTVDADGETIIAVRRSGLSPQEKRALALYDNRAAELAEWNTEQLKADLDAGEDLSAFFREDEIADLLGEEPSEGNTDPDAVPEPRATDIQVGDLFELGDHRLLCGDSTKAEDVARVMDAVRAHCIFTDPPYNHGSEDKGVAASVSGAHRALKDSVWDRGFDFAGIIPTLESIMAPDCTVYICTSWHLAGDVWAWMSRRSNCDGYCVWCKPNPMPSLMKRHWTWASELICYATFGKHTFNFPSEGHASNVWTFPKVSDGTHPTQKPVAVVAHALKHSTAAGDLLADVFLGSGTTLIAAEQLGRTCYAIEIEPLYCQVTIDRWEAFTGRKAQKFGEATAA